jgi:cellulose/xylan binding protein with CBM9 domain/calcineurin-like phosphoesterase family protein
MNTIPRRLISGLACLSLLLCVSTVTAQDNTEIPGPDTLFLTWFGDPTTSIVAQWLEEGEPLPMVEGATDEVPAFDAPRVDGLVIDGDPGEWEDAGLDVGYLAGEDGAVYDSADLGASAKIAWDARGLVVMVRVADDTAVESDDIESLWSADSIEYFVSTGVGSDQRYQVLVAPGADGEDAQSQQWQYDYRKDRDSDIAVEYASKVIDGGYVVELLLPWSNLGIEPTDGGEVAFQFYVNDRDTEGDAKGVWWHVDRDAHEHPESMYAVRLTDKAGKGAVGRAKAVLDEDRAEMIVWADASLVGQTVTATSGGQAIGKADMFEHNDGALAKIILGDAPEGTCWGTIHAEVDGETIAYAKPLKWMTVTRPDPVQVFYDIGAGGAPGSAVSSSIKDIAVPKPFGDHSGLFLYRAVFNELKPGGEYALRLGGYDSPPLRFRTAPATMDEPLVFAEGGDVGTSSRVAQLHKIAASWGPLFGLVGGDCAYANGRTPDLWVKYLRLWRENMVDPDGRLIPMLCAIGNHEVDGSWGQPRERSPFFLALFDGLYPENSYATVDFGDYLSLVLLDSGHLSSHESQTAWIDATLAQRSNVPHVFTAYHVPAYPSHRDFDGKYSALARQYWVPLFEKHGLDVSFEHHDHTYKRTHVMTAGEPDPNGVLYIGDGAWGVNAREVRTPEERPYLAKSVSAPHVIRVTLDGNKRSFIAVDNEGNVIDQYPE